MVKEIAPLYVLFHDKLFSASMTIFSKLLSSFVGSRVTNLVLAICHAWPVYCDLILHWSSFDIPLVIDLVNNKVFQKFLMHTSN